MTITLGKILVGILALGLGILLGVPGKSGRSGVKNRRWKVHERHSNLTGAHKEDDLQELGRALGSPTTLSQRAKRYFTPIDLMRRVARGSDRRRTRRYFHTAAPTRKPPGGANKTTAPTREGNRPPP